MRRVLFDYPNTCQKIDRAIAKARAEIDSQLDEVLSEACPLLGREERRAHVERYAEALYAALEPIFEETRSTNEDMRDEANSQIKGLFDEIAELEFSSQGRAA